MPRLTLSLTQERGAEPQQFDVPDITTALVVTDINLVGGTAQLHDGDRLIATLERSGRDHSPFWRVN